MLDQALDREPFCDLTTTGRVTGRPHTVEIWFALEGDTLYLLSGGGERADWVRNLRADPEVEVDLGGRRWRGRARVVTDPGERRRAGQRLWTKYSSGGGDLASWRDRALAVAVEVREPAPPG